MALTVSSSSKPRSSRSFLSAGGTVVLYSDPSRRDKRKPLRLARLLRVDWVSPAGALLPRVRLHHQGWTVAEACRGCSCSQCFAQAAALRSLANQSVAASVGLKSSSGRARDSAARLRDRFSDGIYQSLFCAWFAIDPCLQARDFGVTETWSDDLGGWDAVRGDDWLWPVFQGSPIG